MTDVMTDAMTDATTEETTDVMTDAITEETTEEMTDVTTEEMTDATADVIIDAAMVLRFRHRWHPSRSHSVRSKRITTRKKIIEEMTRKKEKENQGREVKMFLCSRNRSRSRQKR